ncbi:MAG: aromatic acid exporter family protein [Sarcina sp.]
MRYIYNLTFKMAISATISLALCDLLGIKYGTVAAVISILSIQSTRKKSFKVGVNRVIACSIGILLSAITYTFLGNNFLVFGLFILIFIPITNKLKVEEGMVAAVVLSNHVLIAESITYSLMLNEFAIMIIGIVVAFVSNLFMPSFSEKYKQDKLYIEVNFKTIISNMSTTLITTTVSLDEESLFYDLEKRLILSERTAYDIVNNKLLKTNTYYLDYINMRKNQFNIIKKMRKHFDRFYMPFEQTVLISNYTKKIANNMDECNDCTKLLDELDELRIGFKKMDLPKTREEFENRAQLIQFLNDLEDFLNVKREFMTKNKNSNF